MPAAEGCPVWSFHGAQDTVVPLAGDQATIEAIKACGGDARLTCYPDTGHERVTAAYADPELFTGCCSSGKPATRQK